ncbi:hypothetical protein [Phocaeicola sp.]
MKKIFMGLFCMTTLFSCSNDMNELSSTSNEAGITIPDMVSLDAYTAQKNFAVILSKAVYNNANLRQFIKDEAIKQFDNDYDIFYPFVKDKEVANGETFREILLAYCANEEELNQIEDALPLLNILVPDLSFVGAFNAEKWDLTDNEVAVSYAKGNKNAVLYANGDSITSLAPNELPDFPLLVVKENERMNITGSTRSAGGTTYSYGFVSEVFNGSLKKAQSRASWDMDIAQESAEPFVKASELDPMVIAAYNEFKQNKKTVDRDYLYYGLNNSKSRNGALNTYMREFLYKFTISPSKYFMIADQDGDPKLNGGASGSTSNKKGELPQDEILKRIWTDGKFEIYMDVYVGKRSSTSLPHTLTFSVSPQQLFQVDKIHVDKRHKTAFRHSKYTYTVKAENLKSKWVLASAATGLMSDVIIEPWDLSSQSLIINMVIYERDDEQTIEKQYSVKTEYTNKADFSFDGSVIEFPLKVGYGFTAVTTRTESMKVTTQKNSDNLGTISFNYNDPIIKSDSQKNTKGYEINTYSNGSVTVMILPKNQR